MSEDEEQNNKQSKGKAGPTWSFDGTTPGPGSQIDRDRWLLGDGPIIRILKSDLKNQS